MRNEIPLFVRNDRCCCILGEEKGTANNLLSVYLKKKMGIETTFVSGNDIREYEEAIRTNTKLIYLESPSSAIFSIQDIEGICKLAQSKGIKTIIDNT